jgi:NAD(P)-dependent dehydrogenase (short-subunit alcohol dehydrogenase family)
MATWLITGCSSGIGRALAQELLAHGDNVVATARDAGTVQDLADAHPENALALPLDVTQRSQVIAAVKAAEERFGRIDVLVNNAGYGYRAAIEEGEDEALRTLFATNVFGPVTMIQAVLPGMRARRAGAIVNISSIGVRIAPAGSGYYAATKAALEAITSSLSKEVTPLGITATTVELGAFRTDFYGRSLTESRQPIDDYAETAGLRRKEHQVTTGQQGDPAKAAQAVIAVVESGQPPVLLVLGPDAVGVFRKSLDALGAEVDAFETVAMSTDFASAT